MCLSYLIYTKSIHLVMPHAADFYRQQKVLKVKVKKQSLIATALQSTRPPRCPVWDASKTESSYMTTRPQACSSSAFTGYWDTGYE